MNNGLLKSEWEVLRERMKNEKEVLKELEKHYNAALEDIETRIASMLGRNDAELPHVIRRIEYQRMIKAQLQAALDKLHANEYETISEYLNNSYTDGFVGTVYALHEQDVPVIVPIDQNAAVKAVTIDSKLKDDLYKSLGIDMTKLKKTVAAEITRGIASGMMYGDIARNIKNASGIPFRRARTIVRTEAGRVQEQAAMDAGNKAKQAGADVVKQWSAIRDGKTRPQHRLMDHQVREMDERFSNGLMFPQEPGGKAEEVINCRCTTLIRAREEMDEEELRIMQERASYHELLVKDSKEFGKAKAKDFADFKKKYLKAAETVDKAEKSDHPVKNKYGHVVLFDERMESSEKWSESVRIIKELTDQYDTRLSTVKIGSVNSAGSVDMGGCMYLSSAKLEIAIHEFGHSVAIEALTKYGVEHDADFWKEIKSIKRAYRKDVGVDTRRYISSYEHGTNSVDEFMCEAFTQAKLAEMGLPIPNTYGNDLTYSQRVLETVDKYFKKPGAKVSQTVENTGKSGIINTKQATRKIKDGTTVVNPMDASKYAKLKSNLQKKGVTVMQAKDDDLAFMQVFGAEATYTGGYIMHIGEVPSASALYEEIIHWTQAVKYGELTSTDPVELCAREVAANRKLLKNGYAYGFDDVDFEDIQRNLSIWESKFEELVGVTYDESDYRRDV